MANWLRRTGWLAGVVCVGVLTRSSIGLAQDAPDVRDKRVTVVAANADLRETLRSLFRQVGVNYTLDADLNGKVTAALQDVPFGTALETVLKAAATAEPLTYRVDNGIWLVGIRHLNLPRRLARVYIGPRATPGPLIRIADRDRPPDQMAYDPRTRSFLAVGVAADDTSCNQFVAVWGRSGKRVGQWLLQNNVSASSCVFRRGGHVQMQAARDIRRSGDIPEYQRFTVTIPTSAGTRVVLAPCASLTPNGDAGTPLDKAIRRIAGQVGWTPMAFRQTGARVPRGGISVSPCPEVDRIAWSDDLSVAAFAQDPVMSNPTCIAVRIGHGRYRRMDISAKLKAAADRVVRSEATPSIYAMSADTSHLAVGLYAGAVQKPVVVCFRISKTGAKVVAVKQGLLASPVPDL